MLDLSELAPVDFTWDTAEERPDEDGDKVHAGYFVAEDDFCVFFWRDEGWPSAVRGSGIYRAWRQQSVTLPTPKVVL